MKKRIFKSVLSVSALAFAASIACGIGTIQSAKAEDVKPENVPVALETLALEGGAAVRYATEYKPETGLSYVLKMDGAAYESLKSNTDVTNVSFGILIAPEMYYAVYPFDNQANIDAYYDVTASGTANDGKADLYDLKAVELVAKETVEGEPADTNVYFRGSLIGIKEQNIALNFRGVGYVEYTYNGETEKKFFTGDDTVRNMMQVATDEIADLKAEDEVVNADKIAMLETNYVNALADPFATPIVAEATTQYLGENTTLALPKMQALEVTQKYTYFKDKYTYAWTLERGETVLTVDNGTSLTDKEGDWTLKCTATKTADSSTAVVYEQPFTVTAMGAVTVNGVKTGDTMGTLLYNADKGLYYNDYNSTEFQLAYYYDKVQTGDYVVSSTITCEQTGTNNGGNWGSTPGVAISAGGTGKTIEFLANWWEKDFNANAAYLLVKIGGKHIAFKTFPRSNNFYAQGDQLSYKVVRLDDVIYVYNRDNTLVFSLDKDGAHAKGGTMVATANLDAVNASLAEFFAAGKENAIGLIREYTSYSSYSWDIDVTSGTAAAQAILNETVNNQPLKGLNESNFVYDETTGLYNITKDKGGIKYVEKATGDYVAKATLKSSNFNESTSGGLRDGAFEIAASNGTRLRIGCGINAAGSSWLYLQFNNGTENVYKTQVFVGGETSHFYNYAMDKNAADKTLELTIVRKSDVLYVYGNKNQTSTHANWHLLFTVDATNGVTGVNCRVHTSESFTPAVSDSYATLKTYLTNFFAAGQENAFGFRTVSGQADYAFNWVVDDSDTRAASFVTTPEATA